MLRGSVFFGLRCLLGLDRFVQRSPVLALPACSAAAARLVAVSAACFSVADVPAVALEERPHDLVRLVVAVRASGVGAAGQIRHELLVSPVNLGDHFGGRQLLLAGGQLLSGCRLDLFREALQLVRGLLRELSAVEVFQEDRVEVRPNRVQSGDLGFAHLAGLCHVITHPSGEVHAFLLQLIQQGLDALGLAGDLGRAHDAGGGVREDQAELLQGRAGLAGFNNAGHAVLE